MPERIIFYKSGIEKIVVDVTDRLENLTTLVGANTRYDIRKREASTWESQANPAVVNVLEATCLVDTSTLDTGEYELFLQFDNPPESPRLGPIPFEVND